MKNNKKPEKPPFEVRWETFRKAYFEWARNAYKDYPMPDRRKIHKEVAAKTELPDNIVERMMASPSILTKSDAIFMREVKRRSKTIKEIKKERRQKLKQAFLDLF